ncbi:sugar transferase [Litoreibacter sp.]|nr:sugar transferase [Litoreibacter sp.]
MTAQIRNFDVDEGVLLDGIVLRPANLKGFYGAYGKRVLDVVLVLLTSLISVPLILFFAGLVMLDGRSAFYSQRRIGRGGVMFKLWKLRSMQSNSDAVLQAHIDACPERAYEWHQTQKLRDDPRVTAVGRFLRKSSLDELPQLWNVLLGDMSLVGPRPMLREQTHLYSGTDYFKLRPGLTGLWQVTARNTCSFEARAVFDAAYAKRVGLLFDLRLMVRTIGAVLRGTGH